MLPVTTVAARSEQSVLQKVTRTTSEGTGGMADKIQPKLIDNSSSDHSKTETTPAVETGRDSRRRLRRRLRRLHFFW